MVFPDTWEELMEDINLTTPKQKPKTGAELAAISRRARVLAKSFYHPVHSPHVRSRIKDFIKKMKEENNKVFHVRAITFTPKQIHKMNSNGFYITEMILTKIPHSTCPLKYIYVCEKLDKEPENIISKVII
tara:strand:- start:1 stop:393 length:393 start_codon:yes stop_codon:yes gene_type:complete